MRQLRRKTLAAHVAPTIPASTISFIKTSINMFRRMPSGDEAALNSVGGLVSVRFLTVALGCPRAFREGVAPAHHPWCRSVCQQMIQPLGESAVGLG
jgi:hypothetical protein